MTNFIIAMSILGFYAIMAWITAFLIGLRGEVDDVDLLMSSGLWPLFWIAMLLVFVDDNISLLLDKSNKFRIFWNWATMVLFKPYSLARKLVKWIDKRRMEKRK